MFEQRVLGANGAYKHNKQFKLIRNAWQLWFESTLVFTAQRSGSVVALLTT
ncbi:hypothetical protein D019_2259 [Vibrio parahaemolyticus VP2007-095]|nr:hypothetical protein D019_2259 [Vibrio parahaemolyticus VP2007-095]